MGEWGREGGREGETLYSNFKQRPYFRTTDNNCQVTFDHGCHFIHVQRNDKNMLITYIHTLGISLVQPQQKYPVLLEPFCPIDSPLE